MIISRDKKAFTLIELITVIAIILILMGLLFPAINSIRESARKAQAKNDISNIVTAVKAYYTEYGKYPQADPAPTTAADFTYGGTTVDNSHLFNVLRATGTQGMDQALNPRTVVFIEVPTAKDPSNPKAGLGYNDGKYYDPWGTPYFIMIDFDYDNQLTNPYSSNAGWGKINTGVLAWSLGKDKSGGSGDKNAGGGADDVLSWQ